MKNFSEESAMAIEQSPMLFQREKSKTSDLMKLFIREVHDGSPVTVVHSFSKHEQVNSVNLTFLSVYVKACFYCALEQVYTAGFFLQWVHSLYKNGHSASPPFFV